MADSKHSYVITIDGKDFQVDSETELSDTQAYQVALTESKIPRMRPATFSETHPNIAGAGKAVLDALPGIGGIAGTVLGAPGGPLTAAGGGALGVGAGRGARDLIAEAIGLEKPTSPARKALRIGADTALTAASGVVTGAIPPVVGALGRGAEKLGTALGGAHPLEEGLGIPALGVAEAAIMHDPRGLVAAAAPTALRVGGKALQSAGRGLQRVLPEITQNDPLLARPTWATALAPKPVAAPSVSGLVKSPQEFAMDDWKQRILARIAREEGMKNAAKTGTPRGF